MSKSDEDMLDDLFSLGKAQSPVPSDALLARIQNDARAARIKPAIPRGSVWTGFFDMIGGWTAVGGLAMAGVTGVWFGIAPPASVTTLAADLIGTTVTVDLLDDSSTYFSEVSIDG